MKTCNLCADTAYPVVLPTQLHFCSTSFPSVGITCGTVHLINIPSHFYHEKVYTMRVCIILRYKSEEGWSH